MIGIFSVLTEERKKKLIEKKVKYISIANHGYSFAINTIDDLKEFEEKYNKQTMYKDSKIIGTYFYKGEH